LDQWGYPIYSQRFSKTQKLQVSKIKTDYSFNFFSSASLGHLTSLVCSLINRETLFELRNKLRSDALPVNTIDFSEI